MRIAMRVDASSQIGTGHLRRSLSLAQALRSEGAELRFVTRALGIDSAAQIAAEGFADVVVLPATASQPPQDPDIPHSAWAEVSQAQDIAETIDALTDFKPEALVIDSYAFDARWHAAVREALDCKIVAIDDMPDRRIAPDLLIDHNVAPDHRAKYGALLEGNPPILGGPQYALLGPAYADAPRYELSEQVRSCGIFMGGVDAGNHTATVLDALDLVGFAGAVEVVTTSANPNLGELRKAIASRPDTRLALDLPDLAAFFARHDLQIGAGGGASWERCCIGAPTLLVIVAANQREVAPQLAAEGIVALALEPTREAIAGELADLTQNSDKRRQLAERSRQLVDGLGAGRVAKEILCRK